jgi:hypothetical protein
MKILMPTGAILECNNEEVNSDRLAHGGVEVKETVKVAPKKATKDKSE